MRNKIGISLFILYIIQFNLPWKWEWIENLQSDKIFNEWSGFALFFVILIQWIPTFNRAILGQGGMKKERTLSFHKWVGALSPIVFYIHTTHPGYALLLFLTVVFFLNISLGYIYHGQREAGKNRYFNIWITSHVILSVMVLIISLLHLWIVFYFD